MDEIKVLTQLLNLAVNKAIEYDQKHGETDMECAAIEGRIAAYKDMAKEINEKISEAIR